MSVGIHSITCIYACMYPLCMNGWMDGWMDGWADVCMYVCPWRGWPCCPGGHVDSHAGPEPHRDRIGPGTGCPRQAGGEGSSGSPGMCTP